VRKGRDKDDFESFLNDI